MKFLSKLDPMTVLMLIVIFGAVITMSAQVASQTPVNKVTASKTATQVMPVDSAAQTFLRKHPNEF